ncbi:glycosyltransferase family 2 protein [Nonomuraea ceibae]|uniref:glycosyltransferase family 2 protein n=1 Tax=Nonomuraea ceibae TaxID=1935170 RepID=UPI001C5D1E85|nr:glycosyltransferase family A protein [Nonomuraea ceibae]
MAALVDVLATAGQMPHERELREIWEGTSAQVDLETLRTLCGVLGVDTGELLVNDHRGVCHCTGHLVVHMGFDDGAHAFHPAHYGLGAHTAAVNLDEDKGPAQLREVDAEGVSVVARTPTDLRRMTELDDLLPAAEHVEFIIVAAARWRTIPVPSVGDEDVWRQDFSCDIPNRRPDPWRNATSVAVAQGTAYAWKITCLFRNRTPAGMVANALSRCLDGHRSAGLGLLAGPSGPGAVQPALQGMPEDRADLRVTRRGLLGDGRAGTAGGARAAGQSSGRRTVLSHPLVAQVPPVDVRSVNPTGFIQRTDGTVGRLMRDGYGFQVSDGRSDVRLPGSGAVSEVEIEALRRLAGVRLEAADPHHDGRVLARITMNLAAAGVPLVFDGPRAGWRGVLGDGLTNLVGDATVEDLKDPLRREQYSIRLRRYALTAFGMEARWKDMVGAGRLPVLEQRPVSVVLCTRRRQMLTRALQQVARQRDVSVELVLGLHGISRDDPEVVAAVKAYDGELTVVELERSLLLGEALNHLAARATGSSIAKMDDDDWYGPHHLSDLLLARQYSGAEMVGTPAEFVYLEESDETIKRKILTELPSSMTETGRVTGGTVLLSRNAFEAVGGFKLVPRYEDGEMVIAIRAAGGHVYRGHSLNYIYRRCTPENHTWDVANTYFTDNESMRWRGVFFNDLMESPPI